jgi:hypothetical protein
VLLPEVLAWVQPAHHDALRAAWPPGDAQKVKESSKSKSKKKKKKKRARDE